MQQAKWIFVGVMTQFVIASTCLAKSVSPFGDPIAEYGGATPKNSERKWITAYDYPRDATRGEASGRVVVSFEITVDGRVENCSLKEPSGYASLHRVVCPLLIRRARFYPATNGQGEPKQTVGTLSIDFWMPR